MPRLYVQWPTVGETQRRSLRARRARRDPHRSAHGAPDQGAGVRQQAAATVVGRSVAPTRTSANSGWRSRRGPGHSLTDLEAAADAIIETAEGGGADGGGDSEGHGGRGARLRHAASSRTSARRFQLADGAGFHGDPGYFRTEYQKTLAVTAADVKRVANKYLTAGRVVLSVVPARASSIRPPSRTRARR